MNTGMRYTFGSKTTGKEFNFFVGGMGGVDINNEQDLANYFFYGNLSAIEKFEIIGNNINSKIKSTPNITRTGYNLNNNQNITYLIYDDINSVISFGSNAMRHCYNIKIVFSNDIVVTGSERVFFYHKKLVEIRENNKNMSNYTSDYFYNLENCEHIYFPDNPQQNSLLESNNFYGSFPNLTEIFLGSDNYVEPFLSRLATNAPNATITEILNTNKPEKVNDLSVSVNSTAATFNFSIPSSFNAISKYCAFVVDLDNPTMLQKYLKNKYVTSNNFTLNLSAGNYQVWVQPQDIYGNRAKRNINEIESYISGKSVNIKIL